MKRRFLGQGLRFWAIAVVVFLLIQGLFELGTLDIPILSTIAGPFAKRVIVSAATMTIVSLGLNLIYGFNGQFSLGQWGFYALGAYAAADITYRWHGRDASGLVFVVLLVALLSGAYFLIGRLIRRRLSFMDEMSKFTLHLIGTVLAVVMALGLTNLLKGVVGAALGILPAGISLQLVFLIATIGGASLAAVTSYLFGQPVLKLGGDYFGIATLGLTMVMFVLANNADKVFPEMKGARGMVGIPVVTDWVWVYFFLILVVVSLRNLLDSSHGRAVISVREDEVAARAMGIDTTQSKTLAFVIGSFLAGLAGSLYAHQEGFLHPSTFSFVKSFDPLIIIVFGGLGSITGTVVASFTWALVLFYILPIILPSGGEGWRFVVYPLGLLLIMLLRQQGLLGGAEWGFLKPTRWPLKKKEAQPPKGEANAAGAAISEQTAEAK